MYGINRMQILVVLFGFFFTLGVPTGLALAYILKNSFKTESGSRSNVPKIGILITDGKSQDAVDIPAQTLKDSGIELFAIGKRRFVIWLCVKSLSVKTKTALKLQWHGYWLCFFSFHKFVCVLNIGGPKPFLLPLLLDV